MSPITLLPTITSTSASFCESIEKREWERVKGGKVEERVQGEINREKRETIGREERKGRRQRERVSGKEGEGKKEGRRREREKSDSELT